MFSGTPIPSRFTIGCNYLTWITFLPLVGAFLILFLRKDRYALIRWTAFVTSLVVFLISIPLFTHFKLGTPEMQFEEKVPWIQSWGVSYHLGVDGISLLLVLLTTFLSAIATLSSFSAIKERVKEYYIFMLFLETGMIGVFASLDLFLFYIFWEAMLIPMYFLIGVWGGPRKIYAAVKFFLYTMTGSVLMLVAILVLFFSHYQATGEYTFDLLKLYSLSIAPAWQLWLFLAFGVAFAIKVPMFPFHTWLPDAHVEAPTAGSVILAGVLLKMGTYGFVRFCLPLFPQASQAFMPFISILAIIGIIYGALMSLVQKDIKKLVAYSSVSHLGFVMLGLFAFTIQGLEGGLLQMINHGISTGALFLIVGMIYERRHTRQIDDFGGLSKVLPVFATFFMITTLSSIGLPGTNGFVGEFLILLGTLRSAHPHAVTYAALAATGVILGAVYMLWMYQRVMFGPLDKPENKVLKDLNFREVIILLAMTAIIFWIGIYPRPFLSRLEASSYNVLKQVQRPAQETIINVGEDPSSQGEAK